MGVSTRASARKKPTYHRHDTSRTPAVNLSQHNYTAFLDLLALPLMPWLGVVTTFNVVFIAICLLNALTAYGLARVAMGAGKCGSTDSIPFV